MQHESGRVSLGGIVTFTLQGTNLTDTDRKTNKKTRGLHILFSLVSYWSFSLFLVFFSQLQV